MPLEEYLSRHGAATETPTVKVESASDTNPNLIDWLQATITKGKTEKKL
jgi:hypothetical protein